MCLLQITVIFLRYNHSLLFGELYPWGIFMKKWLVIKNIIFILISMVVVFPVAYYSVYRICKFNLGIKTITNDDWTKLVNSDIGKYKIIQYIRDKTPEDCLVLAFHQKDLNYYTKRKTVRHVDPRLFGFYKLDNKDKAYEFLLDLGIDYVYSPSYMLPTYFNSQIYRIVADPQLCELVMDEEGTRLFKLHKTRRDKNTTPINSENADFSFKGHNGSGLSGWQVYNDSEEYKASNWLLENDEDGQPVLTVGNNYEIKTMIYSGSGSLKSPPSNSFYESRLEPKTTFRMSASVKGKGFLEVFLVDYPNNNLVNYSDSEEKKRYGYFINLLKYFVPIKAKGREWCMLWSSVLTKDYKLIENQFTLKEDAHECRIIFVLNGKGQLSLREVTVEEIRNNYNADACDQKKTEAESWETNQRIESNEPVIYGSPIFSSDQLPLGLPPESEDGGGAIYLDQPDGKECWYYTGEGSALIPPSFFTDNSFQIDGHGSPSFRISAFVKGRGHFDLFIIYYDENDRRKLLRIGRYFLQNDYKVLKKIVNLPERAKEFRVAFRLSEINNLKLIARKLQKKIGRLYGINRVWETYNEPSTLYIDNLTIEPVHKN